MRFTLVSKGDYRTTKAWLTKLQHRDYLKKLDRFGQRGVEALSSATPVESGATAGAWAYEIKVRGSGAEISWHNTNTNGGVNIAIILQYGHGTGTGGYVSGRDYINPAIQPIMDQIAEEVWKAVTSG